MIRVDAADYEYPLRSAASRWDGSISRSRSRKLVELQNMEVWERDHVAISCSSWKTSTRPICGKSPLAFSATAASPVDLREDRDAKACKLLPPAALSLPPPVFGVSSGAPGVDGGIEEIGDSGALSMCLKHGEDWI